MWRAGLDVDGWLAMIGLLHLNRQLGSIYVDASSTASEAVANYSEYFHARLTGERDTQLRLKYGSALHQNFAIFDGQDPCESLLASIYADTIGGSTTLIPDQDELFRWGHDLDIRKFPTLDDLRGCDDLTLDTLVGAIERLLMGRQGSEELVSSLMRIVVGINRLHHVDARLVFLNICRFPGILARVPELQRMELYERDRDMLLQLAESIAAAQLKERRPRAKVTEEGNTEQEDDSELDEVLPLWQRLQDELANANPIGKPDYRTLIQKIVFLLRDDRWGNSTDERFGRRVFETR
jgi:hypothetical protein